MVQSFLPEWRNDERQVEMRTDSRYSARLRGLLLVLLLSLTVAVAAGAKPASAAPKNFFGVHPSAPDSLPGADYAKMKRGGVGSVRFLLNWRRVEPTRDAPYRWSSVDAVMRKLARRGIEPRPFVFGTPSYAGKTPVHPPSGRAGLREWREFLRDVQRRYGRNGSFWKGAGAPRKNPVKVVQILNEVNSSKFFRPKPKPRKYAKVFKHAANALHGVDRRVKVIAAGMFGTPQSPNSIKAWAFTKRLLGIRGVKRRLDGVAVHPYSPNLRGIKYQIRKVRKAMKRRGAGRKKMYITEIGWGSARNRSELTKGPRGQKRMLKRSFRLFQGKRRRWNIKGVNWYTWRDPRGLEDPCEWCPSAGLLKQGGKSKPAWRAFKSFAR